MRMRVIEESWMVNAARFSGWDWDGGSCPVCHFEGAMLYDELCDDCKGSLIYCPRCKRVTCWGTQFFTLKYPRYTRLKHPKI